jgi:hypothetical protein
VFDDEGTRRVSSKAFHENGLLWLVNRALHPYGLALMLVADVEDGEMVVRDDAAFYPVSTGDPLGFMFTEEQENESRARFLRFSLKHAAQALREIEPRERPSLLDRATPGSWSASLAAAGPTIEAPREGDYIVEVTDADG